MKATRNTATIIAVLVLLAGFDVTPLGRFETGLVEANAKGWTVVDMKKDWRVIYPFEK